MAAYRRPCCLVQRSMYSFWGILVVAEVVVAGAYRPILPPAKKRGGEKIIIDRRLVSNIARFGSAGTLKVHCEIVRHYDLPGFHDIFTTWLANYMLDRAGLRSFAP